MAARSLSVVSLLAVVAACATPSQPLPPPPPAMEPPTAAVRRPPARPAPPAARSDVRATAEGAAAATAPVADPPAAAPVVEEPAPAAAPVAAAPSPAATPVPVAAASQPAANWRVRADGVVGCADAAGLRLLQQVRATPGASPRLIAQAHQDGRCLTAFTNRVWVLEQSEGEFVRLRLADDAAGAQPVLLWFPRQDVAPVGGG